MQVAAEHAKAERERARPDVEERLFFDGIALDAADISPGHEQPAVAVEPHFANADVSLGNRTRMAARVAAEPASVD